MRNRWDRKRFWFRWEDFVILSDLTLTLKVLDKVFFKKTSEFICFKNIKIWHEFVKHCRDVYENIEKMNQYKIDKTFTSISKTTRINRFNRTKDSKFDQQNNIDFRRFKNRNNDWAIRLFTHIVKRFRKKKRCFKCFKKSHFFKDKDALCKNQIFVTKNQLFAALIAVNIE